MVQKGMEILCDLFFEGPKKTSKELKLLLFALNNDVVTGGI